MDYDGFVDGYRELCIRCGLYIDITAVNTVSIFELSKNQVDFEQQMQLFEEGKL